MGETGTGKEVVARAIHQLSARSGAFVAVNCSAVPANLVESQFFGHRRGAFSGAVESSLGWVRSADRGTLFLDEIADLPLPAQGALLRVLQEQEVVPVGEQRPIPVDVRVCAATHGDLEARAADGRFRPDLLMRIQGYTLQLPPLRERREDLGLILGALVRKLSRRPESVTLDAAAANAMFDHGWPGNIRELEKCLETALVLAKGGEIRSEHLRLSKAAKSAPPPADLRAQLARLLEAHDGNVTAVAREMGKARFQIQRWMRKFDLKAGAFRKT
jgi:transcriptional regulator with GAF, ATPase, and Fis domain